MQDLKEGDIILIKGFKNNVNIYCHMHFKDLIGLPTRVSVGSNGFYVSHPYLDTAPLNENCVEFEILESNDELSHQEYKTKQKLYHQMTGGRPIKNLDKLKNFFLKKNINESDVESLTPKQKKLINLVDKVESGELSMENLTELIGGIELLIKKLSDEGVLSYINPFDEIWEDYSNEILYAFYANDPSFVWTIVDKYLSDVTKIGNDYYFDASTEDLSGFFNTNYRNEISRNSIESILSGEHDMDFWDVTDDVYRDVYSELTPDNKKLVNEKIVEELKGYNTIVAETELLEEIAQEQGGETVKITDEVISRMINDDETIEYLINKELVDVRSDLYSLYSGCYSDILNGEWYDSLMSELVGFVIDDTNRDDYSYKKQAWDKDGNRVEKTFYGTRYKATNCIYEVVSEWLLENKGCIGRYCDTIEYFGGYERLLTDLIDDGARELLRVPRLDEYADSRKVEECVNGNIGSYF